MASPKLGLPVSTTNSSSSLASATLCVSSAAPSRAQLNISLILEELRVLQQRQIHQMQITEEICRQVLRLGGASYTLETPLQHLLPPLPQLCLEDSKGLASPTTQETAPQPSGSVTPLLACFSSLLPTEVADKPLISSSSLSQILKPHKSQGEGGVGHSYLKGSSQSPLPVIPSSAAAAVASSQYPLALSLALPNCSHQSSSLPTALSAGQHSKQAAVGGLDSSTTTGRLQHACRFCGKMFSSDSSLQIHLRSHTGERPYQCPVCLNRFTTRGNLKVHFLRHREQNPELSLSLLPPSLFGVALGASCRPEDETCGSDVEASGTAGLTDTFYPPLGPQSAAVAAAASITSSTSHSPSTASTSSLVTSLLSNPSLSSSSALAELFKGAKQHFDENTPPMAQIISPEDYSQLAHLPKLLFPSISTSSTPVPHSSLYTHPALAPVSLTASPSSLPMTIATTTPTSETSKLQRLVENLEKVTPSSSPWCGVCLRVLSCPRALRLHQATHLGERPFPCKICGRSFSTKGSLRSHLATHHARPHNACVQNSCPLCQRKFTNALMLQHHIRMHLGGHLPTDGTEVPAHEIPNESSAASLPQSHCPPNDLSAASSEASSLAGNSASPAVDTSPVSTGLKSVDKSRSSSPDLIPPSDLTPDPSMNPATQTPPQACTDPPVLCVSAPLPAPQQREQTSPGDNQDEQQSSVDVYLPKSPTSPTVPKTSVSSSTMMMDCGGDEETNQEGLQGTSVPGAPLAYASPSTSSNPTVSQDINATLVLELDSRPPSPEPMEEDKEEEKLPSPATPKQDQTTVPDDGEPNMSSASETVDTVDAEGTEASQAAAAFGRETRQDFRFSSYERDKQVEGVEMKRLALSGETDASATISLVPTLPSPMSRPEKKTYCCAECGKEYASRSGLKVGIDMSDLLLC
uniref:Spalt-like transcription factor 2 n=1 Tax=Tetraodon nigroviridis TaxID=99883 RepID=H3CR70_TETNG